MKYCKECGFENNDQSNFCKKCGEPMEDSNSIVKKASSINLNFLKSNVFKGVAVVFILLFIGKSVFASNPGEKIIKKVVKNLSNFRESSFQAEFYLEDVDKEYDFLEEFKVKTTTQRKEDILGCRLELLHEGSSVAEVDLESEYDYEDVFFKVLNDDTIYEMEAGYPIYESINFSQEMAYYLSSIDFDMNYSEYGEILDEVLEDNYEKKDGKIYIELELEEIYEIIGEFADIAEDDEKLRESVREGLIEAFENREDEPFEITMISDDMVDDILDILEDEDDFQDEYEDGLAEISEDFSQESGYLDDMEITLILDMSLLGNLKSLEVVLEEFDGDLGGELHAVIDFDEKYKMQEFYDEKDIKDLSDREDQSEFWDSMEDEVKDIFEDAGVEEEMEKIFY